MPFEAVRPQDIPLHRLNSLVPAHLVMPWVGSEAISLHLEALSKIVIPGAHAVLVCDGSGWHQTGGRLVVPDNITLLPLPSYSPQLNPIENI